MALDAQDDEEKQSKTEPKDTAEGNWDVPNLRQSRDGGEWGGRREAILIGPGQSGDGGGEGMGL